MTYFPVCSPVELMAPASVPITALIPNDPQPNLVVPCYPHGECPEPTRISLGSYMINPPGAYYVPLYASQALIMDRLSRPLSALTAVGGS